jgi:hypothetical protein
MVDLEYQKIILCDEQIYKPSSYIDANQYLTASLRDQWHKITVDNSLLGKSVDWGEEMKYACSDVC